MIIIIIIIIVIIIIIKITIIIHRSFWIHVYQRLYYIHLQWIKKINKSETFDWIDL